ncbi:hypothetical protein GOP47_0026004 [Adiantum capillus-veneris]|uniref:Uncharacterized protein n=1 Tax=Adiantum capillus-veneris TaxID=13818 RepID=A0A9D4U2D8_ADICA|nr:hypothetical protein GOP47_0026004 [Adiantum capillus-veneris]
MDPNVQKEVNPWSPGDIVPMPMGSEQEKDAVMKTKTVMKNLSDTMHFIDRQQKDINNLQMSIATLRDSNNALISMYQDEKLKNTSFDKLDQDVTELREIYKVEIRAKEEQIIDMNKELECRVESIYNETVV